MSASLTWACNNCLIEIVWNILENGQDKRPCNGLVGSTVKYLAKQAVRQNLLLIMEFSRN